MNRSLQQFILISQFIMLLALEMNNPFLPIFIAAQPGISLAIASFYSALALALPMVANMIMAPVWGALADRFGYKPMLMRAAWALCICQLLMAFAHSITEILIIRILQGAFAGFLVAMQVYSLSLCGWKYKSQQLARLQTATAIATTCAGGFGSLILLFLDFRGLFLVSGLLCIATTLLMQWRLPATYNKNIEKKIQKRLTENLPVFFIMIASLIILTQIAKFLPAPVFSLYINTALHGQPWLVGLLYSLPAAGILLSAEFCGRHFDRCRQNPTKIKSYLILYSGLGVILMLTQAYATQWTLLIIIRILWGITLAALLPALFALISDHSSRQGYWISIANSLAKFGNLTGIFLGGWLGGWLPFSAVFIVIAAVYLLIFMISLVGNFVGNKQSTSLHSLDGYKV